MAPEFDDFTRAYIAAMLWATSANLPPFEDRSFQDHGFDVADLAPSTLELIARECTEFQTKHADLLARAGSAEQNGHDFLLTREGHGAGFWDRGYGAVGEELSEHARACGEAGAYLGDDRKIYCMGGE